MVVGPEMSRLSRDFEALYLCQDDSLDSHHEQKKSVQRTFHQNVTFLVETLADLGNPFAEQSEDLLAVDTKGIADPSVVQTVRQIEKSGQDIYRQFVEQRLVKREKKVFDPIKKNVISLFRTPSAKTPSKEKSSFSLVKIDSTLFSRLYISCQIRGGNVEDFFKHKNQRFSPSLSQNGSVRLGSKSDLLSKCLALLSVVSEETPSVDVTIMDGAAFVNMLRPGASKNV